MGKVLGVLGTNKARNVITGMFLVYAIIIGVLVAGYANISSCLTSYAEKSSISTNARAAAAAQDRELDNEERAIDQSDREENRKFNVAMSAVLNSFNKPKTEQKKAYFALLAQDKLTTTRLVDNDHLRAGIAQRRGMIELARRQSPLPAPPSKSC